MITLLSLILEIKATEFHMQSSVYKDNFKETFFNKHLERDREDDCTETKKWPCKMEYTAEKT